MVQSVSCDLFLYADDSALVVSGKNLLSIEASLSTNLESLSMWLEENKLSLHLGKTESILFASNHKLKHKNALSITCGGISINSTNSVKYLGVHLDQNMSFSSFGTTVIKKINAKVKFLFRIRSFLATRERKMLCSALIQSNFDYACNSWYRGLPVSLKCKLQTSQNKIVRYVMGYGTTKHIDVNDFIKLKWLNVPKRVEYLTLNLMYSIFNQTAPSYLCDIPLVSHRHNTRQSNFSFVIPTIKTQGSKTLMYNGIKLWNDLPNSIKLCESKSVFKCKIKVYLMEKMMLE